MDALQSASFASPTRVVPAVDRTTVDMSDVSPKTFPGSQSGLSQSGVIQPAVPQPVQSPETPPAFEYKLYFYCLAAGYLTGGPFFAVITCMYFYKSVYIPAGYQPQFTLPMVLVLPGVFVQFLVIVLGKRVLRVIPLWITFIIITATFYPMVYIAKYIPDKSTSFYVLLAICVVQSCFQSLAILLYYDVVAALDPKGRYASGIVVGTSLGGISSVLLQMICLGAYGSDTDPYNYTSVFYNFVLAILIVCIVTAVLFERHPVAAKEIAVSRPAADVRTLLGVAGQAFFSQGKNIFFAYLATYMVYPGVIINQHLASVPEQWSVPLIVLCFSVFDSGAKISFNFYPLIPKQHVFVLVCFRVIFCVFLFFIGYGKFSAFFVVDWWILVCVSLFAFTNGVSAAESMKFGSEGFEANRKAIASKMMSFYLTTGTALGTILSQYIFAKINPDNL